MKMIRYATAAALATTILAGSVPAFAEEARNVETEGQIVFTPNDEEETEVEPPEEWPPVVIPPVGPEGQTGPLTIAYAPTFDFGEQVISNQDQAYNLVAEMQELVDEDGNGTGEMTPYISFAQVQDTRGNNAGWDLEVSLSKFESGTLNNELRGASIEFVSPRLQYNGNDENNAPSIHAAGLRLDADGNAQSVLTAAQNKGAGTSSVLWGDQEALLAQVEAGEEVIENDAVKLHVPGASAKDEATYEATLTWNLTSTADEDGETIPEA